MRKASLALDLSGIGSALNQGEQLQDAYEQNELLESKIKELEEKLSRIGAEGIELSIEGQFTGKEQIISVSVEKILPYPGQPRKTFSKEGLRILKKQMLVDGQEEPLKLINVDSRDEYLLWDGERRWRVAKELGWSELDARVVQMPEDLHTAVLKGFLTREDLNALDRAEAVILNLSKSTEYSQNDCVKGLRSGIKKLERRKNLVELATIENSDERLRMYQAANLSEKQILCVESVLNLGLNVSSFVAGDLSLLSLPEALKEAVRDGLSVGVANRLKKLWKKPPSHSDVATVHREAIQKGKAMTVTEAGRFVSSYYPTSKETETSLLIRKLADLEVETLKIEEREILKNQLEIILSKL